MADFGIEGITELLRRRHELRDLLQAEAATLEVTARFGGDSVGLRVSGAGKERVEAWLLQLPGVRGGGSGPVLPTPDLRGKRLGIVALRLVERFPWTFEPFYAPREGPKRPRVPEAAWDEVRAGLAFRTIELVSDGHAIEVDGYRSRVLDGVITKALERVALRGDDDDVQALLERLSAPVTAAVGPDVARLRARLREIAEGIDTGRQVLEFEPVPVEDADPCGTWLHAPGYLEEGQEWPTYGGDDMALVLQVARGGPIQLPEGVELLQVFVGYDTPWDETEPSLHLRTYAELHPERAIPPPERPATCWRIVPRPDGCLPTFYQLEALHPEAWTEIEALCAAIEPLDPPEAWRAVEVERMRHLPGWSMVGPAPRWFGDPARELHQPGALVVQLGSAGARDVYWGQGGVAYLFHTDGRWVWMVQDG